MPPILPLACVMASLLNFIAFFAFVEENSRLQIAASGPLISLPDDRVDFCRVSFDGLSGDSAFSERCASSFSESSSASDRQIQRPAQGFAPMREFDAGRHQPADDCASCAAAAEPRRAEPAQGGRPWRAERRRSRSAPARAMEGEAASMDARAAPGGQPRLLENMPSGTMPEDPLMAELGTANPRPRLASRLLDALRFRRSALRVARSESAR